MDDVLVYGKTEAQHWRRLWKVLERTQAAGMTLKKEKFVGHIVNAKGVSVDPDKLRKRNMLNRTSS